MINSLTGIRAIAAFWVMIFHSWNYFFFNYTDQFIIQIEKNIPTLARMGYLGVDIFFVLSGFVMTINYWDDIKAQKLALYPQYITYRLARIYPAFIATFLISSLLAFLRLSYAPPQIISFSNFLETVPFILTMTQALFHKEFKTMIIQFWSVNPVVWSLSFEWIAYLAFPFLVLLFSKAKNYRILTLCIGFLLLITMYFFTHPANTPQPIPVGYLIFGWGGLLRIGSEFILGMAAALFLRDTRHLEKTGIVFNITLAITLGLLFFTQQELLVVFLFPFLILMIASKNHFFSRLLSTKLMVYLGEISYAFYLLHFLILYIIVGYSVKHQMFITQLDSVFLKISLFFAYVLVTILFSHLVYRYIEIPMRRIIRS